MLNDLLHLFENGLLAEIRRNVANLEDALPLIRWNGTCLHGYLFSLGEVVNLFEHFY